MRETTNKGHVSTVLYIIYLLYKMHIINDLNLKAMLTLAKEDAPEDLAEWLVKEAYKSGRK